MIFVSDNESWVDATVTARGTATMREWDRVQARATRTRGWSASTSSRTRTTQAAERADILNVGGFSDRVFEVIAEFAAGRLGDGHWVEVIESVAV